MQQYTNQAERHRNHIRDMDEQMTAILRKAPRDAQKKESSFWNLMVNDIPFARIEDEVLPGRKAEDVYPWLKED